MCDIAQLVPIRFWRMGHGRVVSALDTAVDYENVSLRFWGPQFATSIHLMKQFADNWHLPSCHCTETCSQCLLHKNKNDIYTPVPGVRSPVEDRSCPESTDCCGRCCDTSQLVPIRFRRLGHDGVVSTLDTTVGGDLVSLRFWGPLFVTGIDVMKQFTHNWYLPCC